MNEIKNIKEIAKIIDKSRKLYVEDYESISMYYTPDEYFAKKIIENGYQNCKDKVVLTKEEYENNFLKNYVIIDEFKKEIRKASELKAETIKLAKQETARDILSKIKEYMIKSNSLVCYIYTDDIEEIAQKYGVEDNEDER